MVASQSRLARRADDEIEVQVQQPLSLAQELLIVAGQVGILAGTGDFHVERLVQLRHGLEVALGDGFHVSVFRSTDLRHVLVSALQGRQPGDCALDQIQGRHIIRKLFDLERRHQGGAVREDRHQALGDQASQCIAYRRA
ncbi:hypothetical protein D3C78_1252580 [compost metagenome]